MNHILDLIREQGNLFYLFTLIWTALEGETFVIFAGLAASHDLLDIRLLFLAAALGSLIGDQVMFFIGRYYGWRVVARFPKLQPKLNKILCILEKFSVSFILSYRFMYGVRNISALAVGMSHLSWRRFFVLNALASTLWSLVFCGGGYLFGDMMQRMGLGDEDSVHSEVRGFMIACLIVFVLIVGARIFYVRRQMQKEKRDEITPTP